MQHRAQPVGTPFIRRIVSTARVAALERSSRVYLSHRNAAAAPLDRLAR
jgi:hypothetical protein